MGLLDQILGGLAGGGANSPLQSVLGSLLGGNQGNSHPQAGSQSGQMPGLAGNLGGLISAFQNAGLGHIAQSWIGNGPNQPVSPHQLQDVLGQDRVNDMASQAGMDQGSFLSQLSQHLPSVVDGLTPNGKLPDEGTVSV